MAGIPQPAAYKPIVRSNNGDVPASCSMLKFAPFMTLLDLAAAGLMYVQFRRMMGDKEMGYLIAKIEPAISGGSCALGIMHNFLVHIDPPASYSHSNRGRNRAPSALA